METPRENPAADTRNQSVDDTTILLDEFKLTKNIERRKEIIGDLLDEFADTLGAEGLEMSTETSGLFKAIVSQPDSIIRQERIDTVIKILRAGGSICLFRVKRHMPMRRFSVLTAKVWK